MGRIDNGPAGAAPGHGMEPELRRPPPRRLDLRPRGGHPGWGIRFLLGATGAALAAGAAGAWIYSRAPGPGLGLCVFGGLLFLVVLGMAPEIARTALRDARLVRHGEAVVGTILEHDFLEYPHEMRGYHCVRYRFETVEGERIEGEWSPADPPLWNREAGDPVTVLYRPEQPQVHVAYACATFRACPEGQARRG